MHTLEPGERTLHGVFDRDLPPVLTMDSGDTVRFRPLDAGWTLEPHRAPGAVVRQFEPRQAGHALCGPVGTLTFGFDADLNEAMVVALDAMVELMASRLDLSRRE